MAIITSLRQCQWIYQLSGPSHQYLPKILNRPRLIKSIRDPLHIPWSRLLVPARINREAVLEVMDQVLPSHHPSQISIPVNLIF